MTAPSLLDELEGVVAARAEWIESHSDTAWNELALLSVNFVSVNCATLADMAKRLEAAERDARRWRHVRSTAFREFELDHVWLRFAAIEQFDGPIHPLTEAWIDESVDRRIAAAQEGAG